MLRFAMGNSDVGLDRRSVKRSLRVKKGGEQRGRSNGVDSCDYTLGWLLTTPKWQGIKLTERACNFLKKQFGTKWIIDSTCEGGARNARWRPLMYSLDRWLCSCLTSSELCWSFSLLWRITTKSNLYYCAGWLRFGFIQSRHYFELV